MKSIDVVIPNYNYARYLQDCIDSVRNQQAERLRILIIDNASTDDSAAVARTLASADPRIELMLRPRNLGAHASFNDGIDWAQSDYFLILCSDDYLAPGALARAMSFMEQNDDVHMIHGRTHFRDDINDGDDPPDTRSLSDWSKQDGKSFLTSLCQSGRNFVSGPTAIVRTAIQKKVGCYRPALPHTDDLEMWLRFALHGAVGRTDNIQAVARVHASNQSATVRTLEQWSIEFEAAFQSFFENDGAILTDAEARLQQARDALSERAYWSAIAQLCRGDPGAVALMRHAIRLRPSAAWLPPFRYLLTRSDASALIGRSVKALGRRLGTSMTPGGRL